MKVIVYCVHGLRPSDLGCYGSDWTPTPNLDALAARAVVFDQHFADVPSLGGARHSLRYGRSAFSPIRDESTPVGSDLLALLRRHDCDCIIASDSDLAEFGEGWTAQCDEVDTALESATRSANCLLWLEETLFPPWQLSDEATERFFGESDDHPPPPEPWPDPAPGFLDLDDGVGRDRLQRTFAAAVSDWDAHFGALWEMLEDQPWFDDCLLVATAGLGQALGEHAMIGSVRPWLHEELVHVPLLVRSPHEREAGRRVFHLTQTIDIPATVADAFGLSLPSDWHGRSLLSLSRGGGAIREYACSGLQIGDEVEFALRSLSECVILPRRAAVEGLERKPMYFVKPDDRWEVNDLRQPNLDRAEELEKTLMEYLAASAQPGPLAAPPLPQPEV